MLIRTFRDTDADAVMRLWKACELTRPWNDPAKDIARRRAVDDGLFLVGMVPRGGGEDDAPRETLVTSAMAGYDGHRGWVYYVAVDPAHRGVGHARTLMAEVERRLLALGCPKLNLQVREDNVAARAFYARLGYAVDPVTSFGKRLVPDE